MTAWKSTIVKRLVVRNVREQDPFYLTLFALIDKKGKEATIALDESQKQLAANAAIVEKEELYRSAAAQLFESRQENRELHITLDLVRAQLEEKKTSFNQLKRDLSLLQEKNNQLEADIVSALLKNRELDISLEQTRVELAKKSELANDLERQIGQVEKEITETKAAHELALSECEALREMSQSLHDKLVNEAMENSRLKSANNKISRELSSISLEVSREESPTRLVPSNSSGNTKLGTETSATLPITASSVASRVNSSPAQTAPVPPIAAMAKGAFSKFTNFIRSASVASDDPYRRLNNEQDNDEFHFVGIPDICVSCSYPTKASYEFTAHEGECSAVKWSPMSRYLATAGSDRTIKLWSPENVCNMATLSVTLSGCPTGILALDFDTSEAHLAAACMDKTARIYRLSIKKETNVLSGHADSVTAVRFGGAVSAGMVTSCRDGTIRLWDSSNYSYVIRTILFPSRCNDLILLTGGGFSMASGHANKKVCLWDHRLYMNKPAAEVEMSEKVVSLDISVASSYLILAMTKDDCSLHLVDCRANKVLKSFSNEGFIINSDYARAVLSPDGQYLCAGSMVGPMSGSLHVWNSSTGRVVSVIQRKVGLGGGDPSAIQAVAWQPNGRSVASVDKMRRCTIWSDTC